MLKIGSKQRYIFIIALLVYVSSVVFVLDFLEYQLDLNPYNSPVLEVMDFIKIIGLMYITLIGLIYLPLLLRNIIKWIAYRIYLKRPVTYWFAYPFVYDGKLGVHPIKSIVSKEMHRDFYIYNLISGPKDELEKRFKIGIKISVYAIMFANLLAALLLYPAFGWVIFIFYLLNTVILFLFQYKNYNKQIYGLYCVNKIIDLESYLLSGSIIKDIDLVDYKSYLNKKLRNNIEDLDIFMGVLENYLYQVLRKPQEVVSAEILESWYNCLIKVNQNNLYRISDIVIYARTRSVLFLIGFLSKRNTDSSYEILWDKLKRRYIKDVADESNVFYHPAAIEIINNFDALLKENIKLKEYMPYLSPSLGVSTFEISIAKELKREMMDE